VEGGTVSPDLDLLFKLRLLVARYGEMDIARWGNTNGILGRYGALAISRGFPRTHRFAQARIAFAVTRNRCEEIFNPPECMTLWNLPAVIEDQFENQWHTWLDQLDKWTPFFEMLESIQLGNLLGLMQELNLISPAQIQSAKNLHIAAEGKAVPISRSFLQSTSTPKHWKRNTNAGIRRRFRIERRHMLQHLNNWKTHPVGRISRKSSGN
jgi:hypothetical protein